jgi:uracil-DNA glycosylase family 4
MMSISSPLPAAEAPHDCSLCPRLVETRLESRAKHPDYWSAPVPSLGDPDAWLAIVGLAPGKHGANRTGQPFTGDASGDFLWPVLEKFELWDGSSLNGAIILNAVKCLPPGNRPTPEEVRACRPFLKSAFDLLPKLTTIVALGEIAHQSAVKANHEKLPKRRFAHGAVHRLLNGRVLIDSYHCSRLNTNTGRLTVEMFEDVFAAALAQRG